MEVVWDLVIFLQVRGAEGGDSLCVGFCFVFKFLLKHSWFTMLC